MFEIKLPPLNTVNPKIKHVLGAWLHLTITITIIYLFLTFTL